MKLSPLSLTLLATAALGLSACGKTETTTAAPASAAPADHAMPEAPAAKPTPTPAAATEPVAAEPAAAAQEITITANDMMKFSVTRLEAVAGSTLTIHFTNKGTLPKQAMGHNFVVLKKGANANGFATAAMMAQATEYIPAAQADQVLAHTKLLGPGESDRVTFTVPSAAGEYAFLCSFPGHYGAGMKGVLVVTVP